MKLTMGADETQIADSAARFLAQHLPVAMWHREDPTISSDVLRLVGEMGWYGIALAEDLGGFGMSLVDEVIIFREVGRALGPTHILPTAMAAEVAMAADCRALGDRFLSGDTMAGLAMPWHGRDNASHVYYGLRSAKFAVVPSPQCMALYALDDVRREDLPCLDKTTAMAALMLKDMQPIARVEGEGAYLRAQLGVAAMQTGLAEAALAMTVEYAKIRETFGRPIGAYQAVRHPCADMLVRAEAAKTQLYYAAIAVRDGLVDAAELVDGTSVVAHKAALGNADRMIQLHGGIAVTDEHDAHLLMKRAQMMAQWVAPMRSCLDRLAAASPTSAASLPTLAGAL